MVGKLCCICTVHECYKESALLGCHNFLVLLYFPLLHGNLIWFIFSVQFLFLNVCLCVFFFFGQYSECLHLFDISHWMPFFLKAVLLLQCNRKMWNRPKQNMHDKHGLRGKALNIHGHFISRRKVKPSFSPLPKNILLPQERLRKGVWNSQKGEQLVNPVRLLQFETVTLALIPD